MNSDCIACTRFEESRMHQRQADEDIRCPRCGEEFVKEHGTFCEICLSELEA